ncbi:MAG: hypothetical protein KKB50_03510 [Planctomycetes bacterium]|nr:hypothetical protein [Planctomycetota bacterium]
MKMDYRIVDVDSAPPLVAPTDWVQFDDVDLLDDLLRSLSPATDPAVPAQQRMDMLYGSILKQALEYHAECLHACVHAREPATRIQVYMPVMKSYRQRPWNALPNYAVRDKVLGHLYAGDPDVDPTGFIWADDARPHRLRKGDYDEIYPNEYARHPAPRSSANWAWVEFQPLESSLGRFLFRWVRQMAQVDRSAKEGSLLIRWRRKRRMADVVAKRALDVRLYFGRVRPEVRSLTTIPPRC